MRDDERVHRIQEALKSAELDALVCALPTHVLLVSGYWPVIGVTVSVVTSQGVTALLVPEDEADLTSEGWADEVHTFQPSPLDHLSALDTIVADEWQRLASHLRLGNARIGYEAGPFSQPASYVAMNLYGAAYPALLQRGCAGARFVPADPMLAQLMSNKTSAEIHHIRRACKVAERAFTEGAAQLRAGMTECEAAAAFRSHLSIAGLNEGSHRSDGFVFCMSGPNSAKAGRAYARSRDRRLTSGDLVLVHCNSYVDGYLTDITRTYMPSRPTARQQEMFEAIFQARRAAMQTIKPGVPARAVDEAARAILTQHGFKDEFTHSTGHGVGFSAISANARPQIHPSSDERLSPGMVFNVEPALYIRGEGGMRHCDMVAVSATGCDLLTPFQNTSDQLNVLL